MNELFFVSNAEFDIRSLLVMGLSSKPSTDSPIGHFGTGLKYAVAGIMRLGGKITFYTGDRIYQVKAVESLFRDKIFQQLQLEEEGKSPVLLPFTTELGKHWEIWALYRELWSNTVDEDGEIVEEVEELSELERKYLTVIKVECQELVAVHRELDKHFLPKGSKPLTVFGPIEVYPYNSSTVIFYRGIRVLGQEDGWRSLLFSYNITCELELTEDRTIRQMNKVLELLGRELKKATTLEQLGMIEKIWEEAQESIETSIYWNMEKMSNELLELVKQRRKAHLSIPKALRKELRENIGEVEDFKFDIEDTLETGNFAELAKLAPGKAKALRSFKLRDAVDAIYDAMAEEKEQEERIAFWKNVAQVLLERNKLAKELVREANFALEAEEQDLVYAQLEQQWQGLMEPGTKSIGAEASNPIVENKEEN